VDTVATALVVPGRRGLCGILAHHAPMIGSVAPGILRLHALDRQQWFVVGDGVLNVDANGVDVLVEHAVPAADPLDAEEKLEGYTKSLPNVRRL
jgi:F0F1-type ATP synthase epsilon subunit